MYNSFVGYHAIGTLGRQIVDDAEKVRIHGRHFPVKAKVVKVNISKNILTT